MKEWSLSPRNTESVGDWLRASVRAQSELTKVRVRMSGAAVVNLPDVKDCINNNEKRTHGEQGYVDCRELSVSPQSPCSPQKISAREHGCSDNSQKKRQKSHLKKIEEDFVRSVTEGWVSSQCNPGQKDRINTIESYSELNSTWSSIKFFFGVFLAEWSGIADVIETRKVDAYGVMPDLLNSHSSSNISHAITISNWSLIWLDIEQKP